MQVCNPPEICQAHSQHPSHSTVPLEKNPSLTWSRTGNYLMNLLLVTSFMNFTSGVIIHEFLLALRLNPLLACSLSRLSRPPPLRLLRLDLISPTFPPFLHDPIEVDEGAFDELKLFFPNWLWIRIGSSRWSFKLFQLFLRRTVLANI